MTAFLWVYLGCCAIVLIARAVFLSWGDYPRTTEYSRGRDVFGTILTLGMTLWAAWLLFMH